VHGDLRAHAGIAGGRLDLEQAVFHLRHFQFEQLDDELRRGARQDQLRAARGAVDLQQVGAHAVADPQVLLRDHLVARQHRLDAAGLDDGVAALDAFHRAGDEMLLALEEVVQHLFALGVTDLLQDDLLGGLGADAAEIDRLKLLLDELVELDLGHLLLCLGEGDLRIGVLHCLVRHDLPAAEGLEFSAFLIDGDAHVGLFVDPLLGGGGECRFQGREDDILGDVLLARQGIHQQQHLFAHTFLLPILCQNLNFGTRRALST